MVDISTAQLYLTILNSGSAPVQIRYSRRVEGLRWWELPTTLPPVFSYVFFLFIFVFCIRVFFHGHWRFAGLRGKGGGYLLFHSTTFTHLRISTLPLSPIYEYPDIYLQLYIWDNYHIFLIAPLIFTRLLLNKIYHLIELPFVWLMMRC